MLAALARAAIGPVGVSVLVVGVVVVVVAAEEGRWR